MPNTSRLWCGILSNANKAKFLLHVLSTLREKGGRIWHSGNCGGLSYLLPLFVCSFVFLWFVSFLLAQSCAQNEYFVRTFVNQSSLFAICSKSAPIHCGTYGTSKTTWIEYYSNRIFYAHFSFHTQKIPFNGSNSKSIFNT